MFLVVSRGIYFSFVSDCQLWLCLWLFFCSFYLYCVYVGTFFFVFHSFFHGILLSLLVVDFLAMQFFCPTFFLIFLPLFGSFSPIVLIGIVVFLCCSFLISVISS